ncbi:MAG TPA: alternative ribosome rescue factor ArfA [Verrucomicrobiae bacterium]
MSKPRVRVKWNTGERVHKPKKGKGSYHRRPKHHNKEQLP